MREICQTKLPVAPWMEDRTLRLPGLNPVAPGEWLLVDEAYGAQMAYRADLIRTRFQAVHRLDEAARPAALELLERVVLESKGMAGFTVSESAVTCPDGRHVAIDREHPMVTLGHLVQEDFNILEKRGDQHVLTASILCFPASWNLEEKFGRSLGSIHEPVDRYDPDIEKRVQRMFDLVPPERPMWRANFLIYSDPDLFQPRRESERRVISADPPHWLRSERQSVLKLPQTGAVVFSIHNYVLPLLALTKAQRESLLAVKGNDFFKVSGRSFG